MIVVIGCCVVLFYADKHCIYNSQQLIEQPRLYKGEVKQTGHESDKHK